MFLKVEILSVRTKDSFVFWGNHQVSKAVSLIDILLVRVSSEGDKKHLWSAKHEVE